MTFCTRLRYRMHTCGSASALHSKPISAVAAIGSSSQSHYSTASTRQMRLPRQIRDRLVAMQPFWHTRHESMNFRLMRAVAEARLDGRRV